MEIEKKQRMGFGMQSSGVYLEERDPMQVASWRLTVMSESNKLDEKAVTFQNLGYFLTRRKLMK